MNLIRNYAFNQAFNSGLKYVKYYNTPKDYKLESIYNYLDECEIYHEDFKEFLELEVSDNCISIYFFDPPYFSTDVKFYKDDLNYKE